MWRSLLQEEILTDNIQTIDVSSSRKRKYERGAESYDYQNHKMDESLNSFIKKYLSIYSQIKTLIAVNFAGIRSLITLVATIRRPRTPRTSPKAEKLRLQNIKIKIRNESEIQKYFRT